LQHSGGEDSRVQGKQSGLLSKLQAILGLLAI
jgi:hypothetical protein